MTLLGGGIRLSSTEARQRLGQLSWWQHSGGYAPPIILEIIATNNFGDNCHNGNILVIIGTEVSNIYLGTEAR